MNPYQLTFMQDALLMAILVALPCALLSCYLVLKGWSLIGDAVAHAVLPGLVLANLFGLPLIVGAFAAGSACATSVHWLKQNSRVKEDTLLGIVFSGFFALGLILQGQFPSDLHLDHILFGNLLGINHQQLLTAAITGLVVLALVLLKGRDLMLLSFDPAQASVLGLPVQKLHWLLLSVMIATIVAGLHAVGIILVVAMLIAPGVTAFMLSKQFSRMLWIACAIALVTAVGGVTLSFYLDSAPGPTIVLLLTGCFVVTFAWQQYQIHRNQQRPQPTQQATKATRPSTTHSAQSH
ncbi:hypothetical protein BZG25_08785 [Salinivibrio sp. ML198]|uniref:metal ABC transporter permease n=1 Tax=Salinivibrio TaxID=51366 RepID=UPI000988E8B0|nr:MULTISPECIES: metal ABC transporter permease [Salinivibrio]OOE79652.1 hypothetical protein BZG25_08785 [Salinivibrio sp. ML198]OOF24456.1 hypothetical protein BZJ19_11205 [Salinivibrio proteolyticus]